MAEQLCHLGHDTCLPYTPLAQKWSKVPYSTALGPITIPLSCKGLRVSQDGLGVGHYTFSPQWPEGQRSQMLEIPS